MKVEEKGQKSFYQAAKFNNGPFALDLDDFFFNPDDLHKPFISFPPLVQGRLPLFAIAISFGDITSRQSCNTFLIIIT